MLHTRQTRQLPSLACFYASWMGNRFEIEKNLKCVIESYEITALFQKASSVAEKDYLLVSGFEKNNTSNSLQSMN